MKTSRDLYLRTVALILPHQCQDAQTINEGIYFLRVIWNLKKVQLRYVNLKRLINQSSLERVVVLISNHLILYKFAD